MSEPKTAKRIVGAILLCTALGPAALLLTLSLGSGWTYPTILPDRIDFAPWHQLIAAERGLSGAVGTSAAAALTVSVFATGAGLAGSRAFRRQGPGHGLFLAYLPFVLSPIVVGICLYDLFVRTGLAGTFAGIVLAQTLFATAFAIVFFREFWSPRIENLEQLTAMLGGGWYARWRHAVIPSAGGLILVCALQTALFSWLDYGLASFLGGGRVNSLTVLLFGYIREGSVNLAALAALLLLIPALAGFLVGGVAVRRGGVR